jgi:hypothetical protein
MKYFVQIKTVCGQWWTVADGVFSCLDAARAKAKSERAYIDGIKEGFQKTYTDVRIMQFVESGVIE